MSNTNLLVHIESFHWTDLAVDRSQSFTPFTLAFNCISDNGDIIYNHPECFGRKLPWGYFYELLNFSSEELNFYCPWLGHDNQKILLKLFSHSISQRPSFNLADLEEEFVGENNGMLGLDNSGIVQYVFDETSWEALHVTFIAANPTVRNTNYTYFKRFYKPKLTTDPSTINRLIKKGAVHAIFDRIDTPTYIGGGKTLHGEQIQMHFKDTGKSALNIDGTWKHNSFNIPNAAKRQLVNWGFLLPE